jgi:hypothetical protein
MSASVRKAGSLGHSRRLYLYIIALGTWISGGLWLLFHYFLVKQGEFGPQINPLEPWWLKLHGAFAFAAIWIFGLLWGIHITKTWPGGRRRWSGSLLTGLFLWLIISGYLLYYVGDEKLRPLISILHWSVGLGCPIFFLWHRFNIGSRKSYKSSHVARQL